MGDEEKFQGLKREWIENNEQNYGTEIRKTYGNSTVDASNKKFGGMKQEQWRQAEALRTEYERLLILAVMEKDSAGKLAEKACELHRQWLCMFWPDGFYSKEIHREMGRTYGEDPRFKAYYENLAPGCAAFFQKAIASYCS